MKPILRKRIDHDPRQRAAATALQKRMAKTTVANPILKPPQTVNYAISLLFGEHFLLPESNTVFMLAACRMDTG